MMIFLETFFWSCALLVAWCYIGYPVLLQVMRSNVGSPKQESRFLPSCSLIIAAYNEEKGIANKLENMLELQYPSRKLEIIVASDASDDKTNEIVRTFEGRGVKLLALTERAGKTCAQNAAADIASGEILVFTDASTEFSPTTLVDLLRPFQQESVGCVGAELSYESKAGTAVGKGNGAYWEYERWIKKAESEVNSLIGVSGCLYAVRASIFPRIAPDLISDFVIASEVFSRGYRTVYAEGAQAKELTLESVGQEFNMRVRVAVRSINALIRYRHMLNPFQHGFFAIQLISHKVLRYCIPHLLILIFLLNAGLIVFDGAGSLYEFTFVLQLALYFGALLGWGSQVSGLRVPAVHIPFYFVKVNAAAFWASVLYLGGERKAIWTPIR